LRREEEERKDRGARSEGKARGKKAKENTGF
jgi:hypothetical protein